MLKTHYDNLFFLVRAIIIITQIIYYSIFFQSYFSLWPCLSGVKALGSQVLGVGNFTKFKTRHIDTRCALEWSRPESLFSYLFDDVI